MGGEFGVGGGVQSAQNMKSIFYLAENFRRCVVCPLAHQSWGQLFEHLSLGCLRPAVSKAVPKTSSSREGRPGQTGTRGGREAGEGGKWAHWRDRSPMLNNHPSSAQSGGWRNCLNAAFKGVISSWKAMLDFFIFPPWASSLSSNCLLLNIHLLLCADKTTALHTNWFWGAITQTHSKPPY